MTKIGLILTKGISPYFLYGILLDQNIFKEYQGAAQWVLIDEAPIG